MWVRWSDQGSKLWLVWEGTWQVVIGIGFFLDGGGMVCRDHSVAQILSPPVDPILSLFPQTETHKPFTALFFYWND